MSLTLPQANQRNGREQRESSQSAPSHNSPRWASAAVRRLPSFETETANSTAVPFRSNRAATTGGQGLARAQQCAASATRQAGRGFRRWAVSRPSGRRRRARDRLRCARPGATRACALPRAAADRRATRGASGSSRRPPGPRWSPAGAAARRSRGMPKCQRENPAQQVSPGEIARPPVGRGWRRVRFGCGCGAGRTVRSRGTTQVVAVGAKGIRARFQPVPAAWGRRTPPHRPRRSARA